MSELQISLLGIGVVVVLAVYGYSWWQQRQYRKRFGVVFEKKHEDVLQHAPSSADTPPTESKPVADAVAETVEQVLGEEPVRSASASDSCSLVDDSTDYIVHLLPKTPIGVGALAPLWQQRFDFGKPVVACGLNPSNGNWERVVHDSTLLYNSFRISLQLVDRTGAVSENRLNVFRELMQKIAADMGAEAECPDVVDTAKRAIKLDGVCADVDQIIGLNLVPKSDRQFQGAEIVYVASQNGFTLQADGAFQYLDGRGLTLYSLGNLDNIPFQHHLMNQMTFSGLTMLLEVPRAEEPARRFDEMLELARQMASALRAHVVDDNRRPLNEQSAKLIHDQIAAIEQTMLANQLIPGSLQARRLFA